MKGNTEQLLEELDRIRAARGSVGPHHPKFTRWVSAVRDHLGHYQELGVLKRFERLNLARTTAIMWHRGELSPAEARQFRAELGHVAEILEETRRTIRLDGAPTPGDGGRDETIPRPRAPSRGPEALTGGTAMEENPERSADVVGKQRLSAASRTQPGIEQLLAELRQEITRPDGDLALIQKIMEDLMEQKKTCSLVDRLRSESSNPEATWGSVRELMASLWSSKREALIELMPGLLGTT